MKNNLKLLFVSLGCDKNLVDTEFMLGMLRDDGIEMTDAESRHYHCQYLLLYQ